MPKINIDSLEFNTEDLTERGIATLKSLQFLENQMQKLRGEIAVYQTAQQTYLAELKAEIKSSNLDPISVDEPAQE